jgi:hypothetical protein
VAATKTIAPNTRTPASQLPRLGFFLVTALFLSITAAASATASFHPSSVLRPSPFVPQDCEWAILPTVNTHVYNVLHGVAPISSSDAWAVGSRGDGNFGQITLIEHWNGASWSVVPAPNPGDTANELEDVVALSSNDVWAAGYYGGAIGNSSLTMLLHWDGSAWTQVASPNPGTFRNELYDIAALSPTDIWAIGFDWPSGSRHRNLILHWDGLAWTQVTSPNASEFDNHLTSVSAIAPNDVWAVGQYEIASGPWQTLTLHWDGTSWSIVPSPNVPSVNNVLDGVSALSSSDIWAVGNSCASGCSGFGGEHLLTMHWDGTTWTIVSTPDLGETFAYLKGVVTLANNDAWAVGMYSTDSDALALTLHWDGALWSQYPLPSPDPHSCCPVIKSITSLPNGELWSAGFYHFPGNPVFRTLIEHRPASCGSPTTTPTSTPILPTSTTAPLLTPTSSPIPSSTPTSRSTSTSTPSPSATLITTSTPTVPPTPTTCPAQFTDVPQGSTFYPYIRCLACRGIISGYPDNTFRPNNNVTRGQLSKIISNAAAFIDPQPTQIFEDVPTDSPFHIYIGRLSARGYIAGYPCGSPSEPCVPPQNLPYFRPNANATRGQIAKIDSNAAAFSDPATTQIFEDVPPGSTFYDFVERLASRGVMSGYPCGSAGEPCEPPANLPYFRPNANATRGQTSKIVTNTFFQDCQSSSGH